MFNLSPKARFSSSVGNGLFHSASLDLNFAKTKSLIDSCTGTNLITFTRASSGTYVGSDGLIKTAGTNEARFSHNPVTKESLGFLVEEQRTNVMVRSAEFGNASWFKNAVTVTPDTIAAPDGTITADKLVEDSTNNSHYAYQSSRTLTAGITYTLSFFAKAAERTCFTIGFAGLVWGFFNLSTGVATAGSGNANNLVLSASTTPFVDGWYRCVASITRQNTNITSDIQIALSNTSTPQIISPATYTGDNTSGIYIWGAQLEVGAFSTSYIATTSGPAARNTDVSFITGTNFTSWYRQDTGTVFASYGLLETLGNAANNRMILQTDTGAGSGRMFYLASYAGSASGRARYFDDSTTDMFPENIGSKFAIALGSNNNAMSVNGSTPTTDNTGSPINGQTRMGLGVAAAGNGSQPLCGTISRLTYWRQRLPNATLQQLTR